MRLFFLWLLLGFQMHAQVEMISDIGAAKKVGLDSLKNRLYIFYDDFFDVYDLEKQRYARIDLKAPVNFDISRHAFVAVDSTKYFVSLSGGLVYRFVGDSIFRIDNSFEHRMQSGSILFPYRSTIYRYGGYGFWSMRDFFIYFDNLTREWEVVSRVNSKEIPKGTSGSDFVLNGSDIYVFGGHTINPYKRLERVPNDEVWKYDLEKNMWEFLGSQNLAVKTAPGIKYGTKLIHVLSNNISVIDIINNEISYYEHNLVSPKLSTRFRSFYLNHKFYCFVNKRGQISLKVLDERNFLTKKLYQTRFYTNNTFWLKQVSLGSILLVLIFAGWWLFKTYYRKRNKVILLDNGVRYHNKFVEFDNESMQMLRTLLASEEVPSKNLLAIVEKDIFSPAHNERLKVQKINDINLKIKSLTGISDDIIKSYKSVSDRRIRVYKIDSKIFKN